MYRSINLSSDPWTLGDFASAEDLQNFYGQYGCDGVELILCGEEFGDALRPGMIHGLHHIFYPEWIALWQNDFAYLDAEFGSADDWQGFYWAKNGGELLDIYRHEIEVAQKLGVKYTVFHVGDNALDEYFTLKPRRTDEEIIDATCEFLNALFTEEDYGFDLLLENMWLGAMDLTRPEMTRRILEGVHYPRTGIMLDTGHLMVTNPDIQNEEDACAYIHKVLDDHGDLAEKIKGVHLHRSITGQYFKSFDRATKLEGDYLTRYGTVAKHLQKIDPHRPFMAKGLPDLIQRINPEYLVHELHHASREHWRLALEVQSRALQGDL